jgi:phosphotransferase system HPr (HPr) family protein
LVLNLPWTAVRRNQTVSELSWNGGAADGKSILNLLSLGAGSGALLEIEATGPDSEEAALALSELVARRFREEKPRS